MFANLILKNNIYILGIASLHRQGIIHRDIKPSNILINAQSPLSNSSSKTTVRLLIADFSSAVNDEVIELGLYGSRGPTTDEVLYFISFFISLLTFIF